jgi:hypothetical protein
MTTAIYLKPVYNGAQEIFDKIDDDSLDEVIELAKEYDINNNNVRIPSRQHDTIERLKKRLTLEHYDWTTI